HREVLVADSKRERCEVRPGAAGGGGDGAPGGWAGGRALTAVCRAGLGGPAGVVGSGFGLSGSCNRTSIRPSGLAMITRSPLIDCTRPPATASPTAQPDVRLT